MHVASTAVFDPSTVPGRLLVRQGEGAGRQPAPPAAAVPPPAGRGAVRAAPPAVDRGPRLRPRLPRAPGRPARAGRRGGAGRVRGRRVGRPLDRDRPLWEMYVVEGLEDGHIATVTKTHHAAIDGVSGAELTVNLLDLQPEPAEVPAARDSRGSPTGSRPTSSWSATPCRSLARQPVARPSRRRAARLEMALRRCAAATASPDVNPPPAPFSAPRTSLNGAITPPPEVRLRRRSPLDDVKMVKNALGGTVNDVVLALCSGALRRYFADRGEMPDGVARRHGADLGAHRGPEGRHGQPGVADARVAGDRHRRSGRAAAHDLRRHQGRQGAGEGDRRRHAHRLGRVRRAGRGRPGRPALLPHEDRRPAPPAVQRDDLERARARTSRSTRPAPRMVAHVPDGPDHRRRRPQHHGDELHGHDVLRPRRLPRRRPRGAGTSPAGSTTPLDELQQGGRAGSRRARRWRRPRGADAVDVRPLRTWLSW